MGWKEDYTKASNEQTELLVNQSNKEYAQNGAKIRRGFLANGTQRSSYANATMANWEKNAAEAANKIRVDASKSLLEALNARDQWEKQIALQERQLKLQEDAAAQSQANWQAEFNWKKAQADAAAAASAGSGSSGSSGGGSSSNGDGRLWATGADGRTHYFNSYTEFKNFLASQNNRPMTP